MVEVDIDEVYDLCVEGILRRKLEKKLMIVR